MLLVQRDFLFISSVLETYPYNSSSNFIKTTCIMRLSLYLHQNSVERSGSCVCSGEKMLALGGTVFSLYLLELELTIEAYAICDICHVTIICEISGVSRGSVLGPLLFNFYINDISQVPLTAGTMSLYADDMTPHSFTNRLSCPSSWCWPFECLDWWEPFKFQHCEMQIHGYFKKKTAYATNLTDCHK